MFLPLLYRFFSSKGAQRSFLLLGKICDYVMVMRSPKYQIIPSFFQESQVSGNREKQEAYPPTTLIHEEGIRNSLFYGNGREGQYLPLPKRLYGVIIINKSGLHTKIRSQQSQKKKHINREKLKFWIKLVYFLEVHKHSFGQRKSSGLKP